MQTGLIIGAAVLYSVAAVLALNALVRPGARRERGALLALVAGAAALLGAMTMRGLQAGCIPSFGRFDAMGCYALALTGSYLVMSAHRRARGISGILIPYVTALLLWGLPAMHMAAGPPPPVQNVWLALHVLGGFAAYAAFTLASLLAAAYLVQDHNLKHKRLGGLWQRLPPLETLDDLMSRLVGIAFLLFSMSIFIGFFLVHRSGGWEEWFIDPKVGASVATWILLGVLVHMRASADRHGRGVALVTVAGLACLLFSFIGVHLVADSVHAFLWIQPGAGAP